MCCIVCAGSCSSRHLLLVPFHPQAQAELATAVAILEEVLECLQQDMLPLLLPALQTYTRAAATAASGPSVLPLTDWRTAEAAACAELLQLLLAVGGLSAAAAAVGATLSAPLGAWLGEASSSNGVLWGLLGQHAAVVLREADRPFLLEAVDRANADVEATGERRSKYAMCNAFSAVEHSTVEPN